MKRQAEVDIAAMSVATAEKRTGLALRLLEDREAQRARVSKSEARARLSRRMPMMHRGGWDGPISTSATAFAWFIWDTRGAPAEPVLRWFDWSHYNGARA